ncbi:unnamed protein product [Schistocephalus solidus]|uniref:Sodium-coupled monocarboxylate transporter 1 n=1 Tax=Schistocephalus solidus TaxID=70667 RepID=A0A183S8T2_SCHSO|nr:unnamed protein product [Schistocephalus solidus]
MYSLYWPDYFILVVLLVFYAFVGIWYGYERQIKRIYRRMRGKDVGEAAPMTTDDIFLGNRRLGLMPILGTTVASFISAVTLLGTNNEIYTNGIEFGLMMLAYLIAFPVAAEVYVPVFYKLQLSSSHEVGYFEMLTEWFIIIYIAVVLYAPSLALSQATGWDVNVAIIATGLLATFYTAIGGIKAVVWTDLIQMFVMFIGFIMIIAIGAAQLGGIDKVVQIAEAGKRLDIFNFDLNPFVRHSFFSLTFGGAGMVLSIYATNQTSVQRYLACKDLKTTRTAIHLNLPLNIVFMTLQCLGGLVSYATFVGCDPKLNGETTASDQILPYLIMKLFNHIPVVRGLFISSILAAALSTLSSGINSIAGVIMEDVFVEAFFLCRPGACISQRKLTLFARLLAILIGLITIGVAFLLSIVSSGVLQISFSIFGAIGGPILTVFTLGIIMPFVNQWVSLFHFLYEVYM